MQDSNDDATQNLLMENTYARVTGVPRKVQSDVFLLGVYLRPVKDLNELTLHLLDVVHARLMLKKGNPQKVIKFFGILRMVSWFLTDFDDLDYCGNV